jgi:hypothetical protein
MELTSLIMPAVVGGLMLWGKSKASAAFNWIMSDEASVKSMPVALLLTQVSSGDTLPPPPAGYTWNPIEVNFASSPFSAPQTLVINVQVPIPGYVAPAAAPAAAPATAPASAPATTGASGFLTSQSLVATARRGNQGMDGFLTTQAILPAGLNGFFSRQEFEEAGGSLGQFKLAPGYCGTERYQGVPAAVPGSAGPLGALASVLQSKGLVLAPVGRGAVCKGDYVVTADGALYVSLGGSQYRQLHPTAGYVGGLRGTFKCAYGVRRS